MERNEQNAFIRFVPFLCASPSERGMIFEAARLYLLKRMETPIGRWLCHRRNLYCDRSFNRAFQFFKPNCYPPRRDSFGRPDGMCLPDCLFFIARPVQPAHCQRNRFPAFLPSVLPRAVSLGGRYFSYRISVPGSFCRLCNDAGAAGNLFVLCSHRKRTVTFLDKTLLLTIFLGMGCGIIFISR